MNNFYVLLMILLTNYPSYCFYYSDFITCFNMYINLVIVLVSFIIIYFLYL